MILVDFPIMYSQLQGQAPGSQANVLVNTHTHTKGTHFHDVRMPQLIKMYEQSLNQGKIDCFFGVALVLLSAIVNLLTFGFLLHTHMANPSSK
jgi:hypothetical protein